MIYDSLNINKSMYEGAIFTGMALINKKILKGVNYKSFSNFEMSFYPKILKKKKSSYSQINGFWYAMDNLKDVNLANKLGKKNEISKYIFKLKNKFFNV
jgi:NDP-sugar pyrophosphorylase family protein